jgi:hypothetical protein
MPHLPTLKNHFKKTLSLIALCGIFACSENPPDKLTQPSEEPEREEATKIVEKESDLTEPVVHIEELDQYQEYYKEQHTTSFSHVRNKNWFSFRAGKDGILTKILLYGKPTVRITAYYGNSMSGFIREGNPSTGPKYGKWELSRDDILNQLAAQSLTENDSGWITINMRGEIPQESGKTYFLVCEKIPEKSWFGDFAFGEGNPYPHGRIWFNPDHDLVFRTYVGKTISDVEQAQGKPNRSRPGPQAHLAPAPIPVPVQPLIPEEELIPKRPEAFREKPAKPETKPNKPEPPSPNPERVQPVPEISPQLPRAIITPPEQAAPDKNTSVPSRAVLPQTPGDQNGTQNNSLFNRLFKKR